MNEEEYAAMGDGVRVGRDAARVATLIDIVCDVFANEITLIRRRMIGDDTLAEYVARVGNCMRGRRSLVRYLGATINQSFVARALPSTGRVTIPDYLFNGSSVDCASSVCTASTLRHDRRLGTPSQLTSLTTAVESERIVQLETQLALVQRQIESLLAERHITIAAQKVANWDTTVHSQQSPTSQGDAGFCEAHSAAATSVGPSASASLIDAPPLCRAPPPPPPPPPVSLMQSKTFKISRPTATASSSTRRQAPSMSDVLKGLGSVKLRKVSQRSPGGTPTKSRRRSSNTSRTPRHSAARSIACVLKLHLNEKFKNAMPSSELDESTTEQDWADDDDAEPTDYITRHTPPLMPTIELPISPSHVQNVVVAVVDELVEKVVAEQRV